MTYRWKHWKHRCDGGTEKKEDSEALGLVRVKSKQKFSEEKEPVFKGKNGKRGREATLNGPIMIS